MRSGWIGLSIGAALLGGCAWEPFGCENDMQCQSGERAGMCEPNGYCSFPDLDCPSGRRYADAAGGGLAGLCVNDVDEPTSTSTSTSTSTTTSTSTSTTASPTSSTTTSSTTTPVTATGDSSGSTGFTSTFGSSSSSGGSSESSSSTGEPQDPSLVLWYRFEDDPADVGGVIDQTGSGLDAECTPVTCPTLVPGRVGMAVSFDGNNDILNTPDTDGLLQFETAFTVAYWARFEFPSAEQFAFMVGKRVSDETDNSFEFFYRNDPPEDEQIVFAVESSGASNPYLFQEGAFPMGWVHIAGSWDGETYRMYVDGGFWSQTSDDDPPEYDSSPLTVGADVDNGAPRSFFPGSIDEVRIYDRALSDGEIAQLAAQ